MITNAFDDRAIYPDNIDSPFRVKAGLTICQTNGEIDKIPSLLTPTFDGHILSPSQINRMLDQPDYVSALMINTEHKPLCPEPDSTNILGSTAMSTASAYAAQSHPLLKCLCRRGQDVSRRDILDEVSLDTPAYTIGKGHGIACCVPPSSNTRPLWNKPLAREEHVVGLIAPTKQSSGSEEALTLTAARTKAVLLGSASHPLSRSTTTRSIDSCASYVSPAQAYVKGLRVREATAIEAAAEHKYVQEWGFFIKCYSEGRFNLSHPPDPPPSRSTFTHMPAPLPATEMDRLKAFKRMNVAYQDWALQKAHHYAVSAMRTLHAEHAALSFFDRKNEIMRAESGYNRATIPRQESIGAHILLSNEAMVILDTHKDWRFKGSPLVLESPFVRFYAAAPLSTPEGHVVGAFAIFESQPRDGFALRARQRLISYARMAMTDFRTLVDEARSWEKAQSRPDRKFLFDQTHDIPTKQTALLGSGLQEHEPIPPVSVGGFNEEMEVRPADFYRSDGQTIVDDAQNASAEIQSRSSLTRDTRRMSPFLLDRSGLLRHSRASLRPIFSRTNLPTPPYSPVSILQDSGTTSQDVDKHSEDGETEAQESGQEIAVALEESGQGGACHEQHVEPATTSPQSLQAPPDHPIYHLNVSNEAKQLLTLAAQDFCWDFAYVLRVLPGLSPTTMESPQDEFDSRYTELVISHGGPDPLPIFSHTLHLRALRSAGGLIYRDNSDKETGSSQVGYKTGVMLPLSRDDDDDDDDEDRIITDVTAKNKSLEECSSGCQVGIILGAFRRLAPLGYDPSDEEVGKLRDAGYMIRDVMRGNTVAVPAI